MWRTRIRGSKRQIGIRFRVSGRSRARLPKPYYPRKHINSATNLVEKHVVTIPISKLKFREWKPINLEPRVQHFIWLIKQNRPIPPILVRQMSNGAYMCIDGHARSVAFQRMGMKKVQAVVSSQRKMKVRTHKV